MEAWAQWRRAQLTTDFQVATVLTVVPASPNTISRLHQVVVDASTAGTDGDGPPITVRVFPELMTARFAWSDGEGEAIKSAILTGSPRPAGLLVNREHVQAVALAAARAVYAGMVDAVDTRSGPVSVDMDPTIKPQGAIGAVTHGLHGGVATTRTMATGFRTRAGIWRFLPSDVQQTILRSQRELES